MCVCAGGLSRDYPSGAGGLFIGSLPPHISIFTSFLGQVTVCREDTSSLPLLCLVIHQLPKFELRISAEGMEDAAAQAVDFECCLQCSCLCGSVSSEKTESPAGLGNPTALISFSEAPSLSGLSFRLAFCGPWWLQG